MDIPKFIATLNDSHFSLRVENEKLILKGDKRRLSEEQIESIKKDHDIIDFIKQHKAELIEYISGQPEKQSPEITSVYRLSALQEGMLFHSLYDGQQAGLYVNQLSCEFEGLQEEVFRKSWECLLKRHSILRTGFNYDDLKIPVQCVYAEVHLPVEIIDYRDKREEEQPALISEYEHADIRKGFDFTAAPLMRIGLIRLTDAKCTMIWTWHHILFDGWSAPLLTEEFLTVYESLLAGEEVSTEENDRYGDYIRYLESRNKETDESYWRDYLKGLDAGCLLPFTAAPADKNKGAGAYKKSELQFSKAVTRNIEAYARRNRLTVSVIMQGVWAHLLHAYTGNDHIMYGITVAGRPDHLAGVERRVGLYINTLPLHSVLREEQGIAEWLQEMQLSQLASREHQYASLNDIKSWIGVKTDLFDSTISIQNYPVSDMVSFRQWKLPIENIRMQEKNNYALSVTIEAAEEIHVIFRYNDSVLKDEYVQQICGHFDHVLQQITGNQEGKLKEIVLLTAEERHRLLTEFNDTMAPWPDDKTVVQLFDEQVSKTPDNIAIIYEDKEVTYRQLHEWSNKLANHLRHKGVREDTLVPLCIENGIARIAGMLGIMKAGGAYVPVEPDYPQERMAYMIEDSGAAIIVSSPLCASRVSINNGIHVVELDDNRKLIEHEPAHAPQTSLRSNHLAYVIYTSGSTGKPKGVMIEHRSLVNYLLNSKTSYLNGDSAAAGSYIHLSYTFDASLTAIFMPLVSGKSMVISAEHSTSLFDNAMFKKHAPYDFVKLTPAHLKLLELAMTEGGHVDLPEKLVAGGEQLQLKHVEHLINKGIDVDIINEYGPTEATIGCSVFSFRTGGLMHDMLNHIPIGKPIDNVQAYIMRGDRLMPPGIAGELYIGGAGLARGYLNQPELTAEKFIPNPFSLEPGSRLYKTGDMVRWLPDGNMEYLGREDDQVKIRGYRIELGEIDHALQRSGSVRDAVVLAKHDAAGDKILVAYVVPLGSFDREAIIAFLKNTLPQYMVPALLVPLDALPLTVNGKIDKNGLLNMEVLNNTGSAILPAVALTGMEEKIMEIWKEVVDMDGVRLDDSFFNIGGDSIKAIRVVSKLKKDLAADMQLADFFEYDTIEKLVVFLGRKDTGQASNTLRKSIEEKFEAIQHNTLQALSYADQIEDIYPMSDIQKGMLFSSLMHPGLPMYHDQFVYEVAQCFDAGIMKKALELMVQKHSILRTNFIFGDGNEEVQVVWKTMPAALEYNDLQLTGANELKDFVRSYLEKERLHQFDLSKLPLWRITVFRIRNEKLIFVFQFHHAILDGWSRASFVTELNNICLALQTNPAYIPIPLQSTNKHAVLEEWMEKTNEENRLFWQKELSQYKHLDIFTEETILEKHIERYDPAYLNRIKRIAKDSGRPVKSIFFAAYLYALKMLTFDDELTVGMVAHNRPVSEDGDKLLGCFLNTIPVRFVMHRDKMVTWKSYVESVCDKLETVKKKERVTLFDISNLAEEKSDKNSFFDTIFNFIDFHVYDELHTDPGQVNDDGEIDSFELTNTHLDTSVNVTGDALTVSYILRRKFKAFISLEEFHAYFNRVMDCYINFPDEEINNARILGDHAVKEILHGFNDTAKDYPNNKTLVELFEQQAAKTPDAIAVVCKNRRLTYKELNERANQLAHHLIIKGIQQESLVPVLMYRSPDMMVAILGILKAGGAYVPVDPDYPSDRITGILDSTHAGVTVSTSSCHRLVQPGNMPVIDIDEHEEAIRQESKENTGLKIKVDNLAYVIFTSGSTGKPKGVMIEHKGMVNHLFAKINDLRLDHTSVIAQNASHCFDISVWQFFAALVVGGKTVIFEQDIVLDPPAFLGHVASHQVTILELVPSYLSLLLNTIEENSRPAIFSSLACLVVTGETVKPSLVQHWFRLYPGISMVNAYGPTEASDDITHHMMDRAPETATVSIGRPVQNMKIYIADSFVNLCPVGVKGEIVVAGVGVGRGYLNNTEETARAFLMDPFEPETPSRLYKTGDYGRMLEDGSIEFFGRKDHQVKIRGFRIELEEIESVITLFPLVKEAVVLVKESSAGEKYLSSFLVVKPGFVMEELRAYLAEKLPDYMIPLYVTMVDQLPLTVNGKTDRKSLQNARENKNETQGTDSLMPRNETEENQLQIWKEILQVEKIGIRDNFFELGGDSFKAIRLVSRSGRGFSVPDVYKHQTIEKLAAFIALHNRENQLLHELTPPGNKYKLAIIAVPNSAGDPVIYQDTTTALMELSNEYALFGVDLPRTVPVEGQSMLTVLQNLSREIVDEIKKRIHVPVIIYGQCNGSGLALQLAMLMQEENIPCMAVCIGAALPRTKIESETDLRSDETIAKMLDMINGMYPQPVEDRFFFFSNFRYDSMLAIAAYNHVLSQIKQAAYRKLRAPLYCIVGDRDPLTRQYTSKYRNWKNYAESGELIVMKDVGHFMWRDKPQELAQIILDIAEGHYTPKPFRLFRSLFAN